MRLQLTSLVYILVVVHENKRSRIIAQAQSATPARRRETRAVAGARDIRTAVIRDRTFDLISGSARAQPQRGLGLDWCAEE